MKKWNGNSFNKTKLATAVAVVSLGLMAGGCGSDGDRSTSVSTGDTGSVTLINRAEGTVTGHVQDTNGNPVAGATVSLAGQTTTTDAAGNYLFDSVQVLNSTGTDDNAAGAIGNALQVVVQATGYLGATVTVAPLAQVDANDSGQGNASTDVNAANMFLDGFLAPAGTAVLPKLGASITGTLRLAITGEVLPLQTVALDFADALGNGAGFQEQPINGVAISYAVPTIENVTTAADGTFTFTNLPEDSAFNLVAEGWSVAAVANPGDTVNNLAPAAAQANAALVGTSNENIVQTLGMVSVSPIADVDLIPPVVWSVNTVKNPYDATLRAPASAPARAAGVLNDDEVGGITINFSEQVTNEIDENSIVIWNSTAGVYMNSGTEFTTTLATDGRSVRVDFVTPFDGSANQFLEVNLLVDDFVDTAGNVLVEASSLAANPSALAGFGGVNPVPNNPGPALGTGFNLLNDISYDGMNGNITKNMYLRLDLCTFGADLQGASQVPLTQLTVSAANTAGTTTAEDAAAQTYSGAFNDTEDTGNWFAASGNASLTGGTGTQVDQLNVAEADGRLDALAVALGIATDVQVDRPLVTFTTTDAAAYTITAAATAGGAAIPVVLATGGVTDTNASDVIVTVAGQPAGQVIEVLVDNAVAGQSTVTITPSDGFGNSQGATTITLVDNVEPTVILQSAHGLAGTTGAGTVNAFGDGAEISDGGVAAALSPAWRVNPGHFTESRSTATPLSQALENAANTAMDAVGASAAQTGGDPITIVYDATAWAARAGSQSFQTAISMSESLASATLAYSGTATISGVTVDNDITRSVWVENGNTQTIPGDIVRFSVSDIEVMDADAGATINMVGSTDLAGNTAAANAFATVVDDLPPLVETAIYNSTGITINFHEGIVVPAGAVIRIDTADDNATGEQVIALTGGVVPGGCSGPAVTNNVLSIPQCYLLANGFNYANAFDTGNADGPLGDYAESVYGTINNATPRHTSLIWSSIQDEAGNSWANTLPTDTADPNFNYNGAAPAAADCTAVPAVAGCLKWTGLGRDGAGVGNGQSPIFAMIDGLGPFQILQANGGFVTTSGGAAQQTGSFVLTFSHPFWVRNNDTTLSDGVTANTRLALSDNANTADPAAAAAATTISQADCSNFFQYVSATANTDFLGGAGGNSSTCTVEFGETGTATSDASATSSSLTVNIVKNNGVANQDILIADEVRVRPAGGAAPANPLGYVFQSSLTLEVDTVAVSPSN